MPVNFQSDSSIMKSDKRGKLKKVKDALQIFSFYVCKPTTDFQSTFGI